MASETTLPNSHSSSTIRSSSSKRLRTVLNGIKDRLPQGSPISSGSLFNGNGSGSGTPNGSKLDIGLGGVPRFEDEEDGVWRISVTIDTAYDTVGHRATKLKENGWRFVVYVNNPTRALTLLRSSKEFRDLQEGLNTSLPAPLLSTIPPLPAIIPPETNFSSVVSANGATQSPPVSRPGQPARRRSSFLNAISAKFNNNTISSTSNANGSRTPELTKESPSTVSSPPSSPSPTDSSPSGVSELSAYLTTLALSKDIRLSKPWRKFMRVRKDDLTSKRVERVIRRVGSERRSDSVNANRLDEGFGDWSEDGSWSNIGTAFGGSVNSRRKAGNSSVDVSDAYDEREGSMTAHSMTKQESTMTTLVTDGEEPKNSSSKLDGNPNVSVMENTSSTAVNSEGSIFAAQQSESDALTTPIGGLVSSTMSYHNQRPVSADPDKASARLKEKEREATMREAKGKEYRRISKKKVTIDEFELLRVLGRGCAGKVLLVRQKTVQLPLPGEPAPPLLAMKSIIKLHVLAHQELQHTLTEQAVLKRMSKERNKHPFIVRLRHSFHDKENLFLVMDFHPGGDLATQLARWGKLGRDRARFYAAEIVEGVEGLHSAGVIYRDLKPENILLGADGHIVLIDFGLSKEFEKNEKSAVVSEWMNGSLPNDETTTFCGTAEYLAPEVIQGVAYTYNVDWWSFGTMLFEMLIGITPFYASSHTEMYTRVLHDELVFPDERPVDSDTKSLIRLLLQRNPILRLSEPRIKKHAYFSMIDWDHVYHKRYIPPYIPPTDPDNAADTQNFDETFLDMDPTLEVDENDGAGLAAKPTDEKVTADANTNETSVQGGDEKDVFEGYSYRERDAQSILMDLDERKSLELDADTLNDSDEKLAEADGHERQHTNGTTTSSGRDTASTGDGDHGDFEESPATSNDIHASVSPIKRNLRERSGVSVFDKNLLTSSEDVTAPTSSTSDDEEEDGWDLIEAPRNGLHEVNGGKGATLFARGVVDRYKLGVLKRKQSKLVDSGSSTPKFLSPSPSTDEGFEAKVRRGLTFKKKFNRGRPPLSNRSASSSYISTPATPPSAMSTSPSMPTGIIPRSTSIPTIGLGPAAAGSDTSPSVSQSIADQRTKGTETEKIDEEENKNTIRSKSAAVDTSKKIMNLFSNSTDKQ